MEETTLNRDSFIFYRSFFEAISELEKDDRAIIYDAICQYSLNGKMPDMSGVSRTVWILIKPQLEANIKRYRNGSKAKHKQNRSKVKASSKQNRSKIEANKNVNVNDNVNKNENKKLPSYPSLEEFVKYFNDNGFSKELATRAYNGYSATLSETNKYWLDSMGNKVLNWKQKCQNVWFRPENKTGVIKNDYSFI